MIPPRFPASLALVALLLTPALAGAAATTPNPGLRYYYPAPDVPVVDVEADIIVYGGTSGGVVAAVQAVRRGKSVALVVFGRHVGGLTSGGLTATDGVSASVQGGITREYFDRTGNGGFRPSKAEAAFEALLADPVPGATWDAPVPTYFEQRIATVEKVGARLVALHMENGSVFRGRMFIDCSYEGDLMARAGVSHTYGRESRDTYGESRAGNRNPASLPGVNAYIEPGNPASGLIYNLIDEPAGPTGSADTHVQAYNFRMYTVQNANPANLQPLWQPPAYDASQFEILYRYHRAGGTTSMSVGNDINNHEMFNRGVSTDHIGGNRWPDGQGGWIPWANADYATRELMYQSHVAWQLGMLWYIKTDARYRALATDPDLSESVRNNIQSLLNKVDQLGLPLGEYPETGGWSHELYVREARRMVSDFVVTQAHYDRQIVVPDAVGLANYSADSHHVRRIASPTGTVLVEGDTGGGSTTPWRLPYRALTPRRTEAENLLVTWAISASHVAFCSMRMEPCLMALSESAATAASLALDRGETVQDLPYEVLRLHLLADGQILGETSADVPEMGIVVDNADASGVAVTGAWTPSSASGGYYGSNYLQDENTGSVGGKAVAFTPTLTHSTLHEVFLRWTSNSNRATNVAVEIIHAEGAASTTVNQRSQGGLWVSLGTFPFVAGTSGQVVIRNDGADGYVIADAVMFVSEGVEPPPIPDSVHVLAARGTAEKASAEPGRFHIFRDTVLLGTSLTVNYTVGGTAVPGTHYQALTGTAVIPAGQRVVAVDVTPITNSVAQGTRTVVLTLRATDDYLPGTSDEATVSIIDPPYASWRFTHFGATGQADAPASALDADPDADGVPNALEFLLGSNPLAGSGSALPAPQVDGDALVLDYWHRGAAAGLVVNAQTSTDLRTGEWATVTPVTVSWDPATGDRQQRVTLPLTEAAFFRLALE